jgi:hypothetical protein
MSVEKCSQRRISKRHVSMGSLPDSLSTLAQGLGDLFPSVPPGSSERDAFTLGHFEVPLERRSHPKDFERIGVWVRSNGFPRFPE